MNKTTLTGCFLAFRLSFMAFCLLTISAAPVRAADPEPYEEIYLSLHIQRIGNLEIPAVIYQEQAYLPVKTLFDFLKIKNESGADLNTIHGFLIDPKQAFVVDKLNNHILYQGKTIRLKPSDLIRTESDLYLKSDYYGLIFGLSCTFNFRTLSVTLKTDLELPIIRDQKLQEMRKNISRLKGEKKVDSIIDRKFQRFRLGVADWSITATQDQLRQHNTRANLFLGAIVAGGEASINLNYDNLRPFNEQDQSYRWRYVNNDHAALTQITAGRIYTASTASLFGPVNGIQFTNTPTTYRKSFGSYRINNTTEPGWTVELYVNNVLVDYVKADASGFYGFDVPLVYGNSAIQLRVYGPFGEERRQEQNISIPFNFLPAKKFEYNLSSGSVEDRDNSFYTRAEFNYGLNSRLSIGTGAEYLSSVNSGHPMPFIKSSLRASSSLLLSGEYAHGVRTRGILNYRLPGDVQLEVNYARYAKEQTAIRFNYIEERKITLSVPVRGKGFSAYSRFSYNQYVLRASKITNADLLISAMIAGLSTNFTTSAIHTSRNKPEIFSELALTFRLPMAVRFTPHLQYQYRQQGIRMLKAELEKNIGRMGFLNFAYENNLYYKLQSMTVGLRLNLNFMQSAFSVMQQNRNTSFIQSGRGSLIYNDNTNKLTLSRESHIGKGGLTILAFLDLNGNGRRDANESKVAGLKVKPSGGWARENAGDTTITISGLESYADYVMDLEGGGFNSISWVLKKKSVRITAEPNYKQVIEIPVSVVGEVSGNVYMDDAGARQGMGRMLVEIYDRNAVLVAQTVSETDGYFSIMGLAPGQYRARINGSQLEKLAFICSGLIPFEITRNKEGDVVDGLEFILKSKDDGNKL